MNNLIGDNAGKIWNYLEENDESTLTNLKKVLDLKGDLAALSLGWLAKEGKVEIEKKGVSLKIKIVR